MPLEEPSRDCPELDMACDDDPPVQLTYTITRLGVLAHQITYHARLSDGREGVFKTLGGAVRWAKRQGAVDAAIAAKGG